MIHRNPMVGQVLGGLFGQALGRRGMGKLGGGLGGIALGTILAGAMRNRGAAASASTGGMSRVPGGTRPYANQTALLVMLLPLAMRWVQKNGGIGPVLDRFRQKGFGRQAQSWVE